MTTLYDRTCQICNKQFQFVSYPSTEKRQPRQTCSKKCQYTLTAKKMSRKTERICKFCGQHYTTEPCFKKSFCSRKCQLAYMRTLTGDKNHSWKPVNEEASYQTLKVTLRRKLVTVNTVCADCGKSSNCFEIHHIDKNRNNNVLSNLVVLCLNCHADRHKGERAERIIRGSKNHSHNVTRKSKICQQCLLPFKPYYDAHKFCSKKCSKAFRDSHTPRKLQISRCGHCNSPYSHKPSVKRKFCSLACYNNYRKPSL